MQKYVASDFGLCNVKIKNKSYTIRKQNIKHPFTFPISDSRASARGKSLPENLNRAIKQQIATLSNTPQLEEIILQDRKPKDTVQTEKPIRWTQEEAPTLWLRRMTPSEYENLQGFPKGWTEIDTEL